MRKEKEELCSGRQTFTNSAVVGIYRYTDKVFDVAEHIEGAVDSTSTGVGMFERDT